MNSRHVAACLTCVFTCCAWAQLEQPAKPSFHLPYMTVASRGALELHGKGLGPEAGCAEARDSGPYVAEPCGVRVEVAGILARLYHVDSTRIGLWVPLQPTGEAGMDAPVRVCVHEVCSDPATIHVQSNVVSLQLVQPAYVHMPLWVVVNLPAPYRVRYPCHMSPWLLGARDLSASFGGAIALRFEVRRDGVDLEQRALPERALVPEHPSCFFGFNFEVREPRLPLHLLYDLNAPGLYSIRLTGTKENRVVVQSEWIDVEVQARPAQAHEQWLRALEANKHYNETDLLYDVVPSLLAWPDARALRILAPYYAAWLNRRRFNNGGLYVYAFLAQSARAFDPNAIRRVTASGASAPPRGRAARAK